MCVHGMLNQDEIFEAEPSCILILLQKRQVHQCKSILSATRRPMSCEGVYASLGSTAWSIHMWAFCGVGPSIGSYFRKP